MNIGIIGCGSIGQFLLKKLNEEKLLPGYRITAIFDEREKSIKLLKDLSTKYEASTFRNLNEFLNTDIDLVVECANIQAVHDYAQEITKLKDLLLISVGALASTSLYDQLISSSKKNGAKIYLPSGAIGGLDIVQAANIAGGLESVTLVSRKPVTALSTDLLSGETVLFEGSAKNAIKKYPKNANVAITLSLAGIGVDKTSVKIIADPKVEKNIHTIHAHGDFGEVNITIENNPSPENEKTSYLTALSVLSSLQSLTRQVMIS